MKRHGQNRSVGLRPAVSNWPNPDLHRPYIKTADQGAPSATCHSIPRPWSRASSTEVHPRNFGAQAGRIPDLYDAIVVTNLCGVPVCFQHFRCAPCEGDQRRAHHRVKSTCRLRRADPCRGERMSWPRHVAYARQEAATAPPAPTTGRSDLPPSPFWGRYSRLIRVLDRTLLKPPPGKPARRGRHANGAS